jgi:LmbE family N-acetylglucosaminyl deacetylase
MKYLLLLLSVLFLLATSCSSQKTDYKQIAAFQDTTLSFPILNITDTTRVLAIFPHADDETIAGGLIAYFSSQGASVHLLTLCWHDETRTKELNCSAEVLGISEVEIAGLINNSWDDIMKDDVKFWYDETDSIQKIIRRKTETFRPHIIITYDSEIGGYGHPEHLISAIETEKLFNSFNNGSAYRPEYLFQITLTDKLEDFLVASTPNYAPMLKKQNSNGLPAPNAALDIRAFWPQKNEAALCHASQFKTLKKFYIIYDKNAAEKHQYAFSHEYYKVIGR